MNNVYNTEDENYKEDDNFLYTIQCFIQRHSGYTNIPFIVTAIPGQNHSPALPNWLVCFHSCVCIQDLSIFTLFAERAVFRAAEFCATFFPIY